MMIELPSDAYLWIKALHIISVMAWMAGMLYLPRLFVYHCEAETGSELSEKLKIMERRLLYAIITPAMIASLLFGSLLFLNLDPEIWLNGWVIAKGVFSIGFFVMYDMMRKWRNDFEADANTKSQKFYRMMNEVPTVLMIGIVIFVVVKPF